MRRNVVGCLLAALTLSVGAVAQQKNQAEIDLQTAIRMETLGDCKGAIKRYDEILRKYRKDANVSGKAIDHMLDCYDTLSEIDVRNASLRLAREYPEHKEAIAFASARHGQGGQSAVRQRSVIDGDPSGALQFNAGASMGVDGRTLAVIDWSGSGDIAVQDIATAAIRRLKVKDGTYLGDEEGATGTWTMLSPDQSKVAFLWTPGISKYEQLRVVANTPGAKSRIVVETNDDEIGDIEPAGWAPDGKSLYVVIRKDAETSQIVQMSVDDGRILRLVKPLEKRFSRGGGYGGYGGGSRPAVSPDGRYIAYSALPANPDKPRSARIGFPTPPEPTGIYVTTTDGAGIEVLVTGGSGTTNQFPVWAPDGAHLLFLSDRPLNNRSGELGLWWVEMRDGKPVGPASPAWPQLGKVFPLGMTRSGSFYYLKEQSGDDVFTIRVPARGLLDRGAAVRLSDRATNTNRDAVWSPDGKSIAFKRRRSEPSDAIARTLNTEQVSDLVVRSLESGDEKIYSQGFFERAPLIWSHDGNSILTVARRGRAETYICLRLDLRSSQVTTIETTLRAGTFRGIGGAVGPDNTTLYIRDWDPAGNASVVALDLATGNKRTIWSQPVPDSRALSAPALSPDGRTLVMILKDESEKGRVIRVGIDGSGYREIATGLEGPSAPRWEGRAVLFVERRLGQFRLMRVSADGGNPEFTGLTEPDAFEFDVSPDGSNLVITEHLSNQLWAIDNLESLWKAGR